MSRSPLAGEPAWYATLSAVVMAGFHGHIHRAPPMPSMSRSNPAWVATVMSDLPGWHGTVGSPRATAEDWL